MIVIKLYQLYINEINEIWLSLLNPCQFDLFPAKSIKNFLLFFLLN